MPNILAHAETRAGELRKVAFEAVTAARGLADKAGGEVHAMVFGGPGIAAKASQLAAYGADVVVVVEHSGFANRNPEAEAATVALRARSGGYRLVVASASQQGRDLAPRVAAKLGVPIASDVIAVRTMTPEQFIAKWKAADLKERAAAHSHFNDLCRLLDEPTPSTLVVDRI